MSDMVQGLTIFEKLKGLVQNLTLSSYAIEAGEIMTL